jgi:cytochrome P450
MVDLIEERKTSQKKQRYDLFSSLLDAYDDDEALSEGETKLSTRELFGALFCHLEDVILL